VEKYKIHDRHDPRVTIDGYNNARTHQGKRCQGRMPRETFIDEKKIYASYNYKHENIKVILDMKQKKLNCPLVTIAIPTYNRADAYLREAIQSAINQTYPNLEIIISDNCSSDDTELIVESFNDPRIQYYRHDENIGANNNFNFCLKKATGVFFLLLHDDDLIDEGFVKKCIDVAKNRLDIGIIRTGTRVINSDGNILNETPNTVGGLPTEDFIRVWFAWKTALYLCSTLFNTKRLKEIGGFQSRPYLFQDVFAELKLASKYGRMDIQDVKASFRRHPDEMTFASGVRSWCEDSLFLLDSICDLVTKDKATIRKEGLSYFSTFNHELACKIESPLNRYVAYLTLIKAFKYVFLRQLFLRSLRRSGIYQPLRFIKSKIITSFDH
jgi:glycosyltransferase involved in cell wall biosynthesis